MGVVFVVLVALMILAMLMGGADNSDKVRSLLDRLTGNDTMPAKVDAAPATTPTGQVASAGLNGKQVAAIALGIALSRTRSAATLPPMRGATAPASSWLSDGRRRSMDRPSRVSR
ncbi:MAG: OadG family protein [Chloroflexi bacterium]|nr:OadG family protein [Chloroflexota bacterium]